MPTVTLAQQFRQYCTDWDGSQMADGGEPRVIPTCAELREAATALEARLPPDSRYSVADIRKIAADRGPHFDGCARACLVWAADTLAAADVVIRELRDNHD